MLAFMNLEKYKETYGLQQWQALIAFGSGGVHGLGLGNGVEKFSYLPFAHTDFIFPMIGEELGLMATLGVVFCYLVIIIFGTIIAIQARDRFGMLFGFGVVVMLALQAALNIGVTTSLPPEQRSAAAVHLLRGIEPRLLPAWRRHPDQYLPPGEERGA